MGPPARAELWGMESPTLCESIRDSSLWHANSRQPEHIWGGGWRFNSSAALEHSDAGDDLDAALTALLGAPEVVRSRRWPLRAPRFRRY